MARYQITAPDGSTYEITAPDGASEQAVMRYAKFNFGQSGKQVPKKYEGWGDYAKDAARTAVGQGLALGFGDEITAGVRSLVSDTSYDDALQGERAAVDRFAHNNPATAFGLTLAGGAALPFGAIRGATTAVGAMARGAGVGAGFGAASGFGASEGGVDERITGAGTGAAIGGVLGGVLPAAVIGARAGYKGARNMVGHKIVERTGGPAKAAEHIIARRLEADGRSPLDVYSDLRAGKQSARLNSNSRAHLPETIADTSDDLQRLAGSVYRQGGEGGTIVREALEGRQRGPANPFAPQPGEMPGQHADIIDAVRRSLTVKTKGSGRFNAMQIQAEQKALGNRLYAEAKMKGEPFDIRPALDGMAARASEYTPTSAMGRQLRKAARLFVNKKQPINTVSQFDNMKKELDDMISKSKRSGDNNLARELTIFKDDLIASVHMPDAAGNPTRNLIYDKARKTWGSAAERREAIELGQKAFREDSEVTAEMFSALDPGQQALFRIGLMDSVKAALGRKRPGNDSTTLFQEPRVVELLREVVPNTSGVFANRSARLGDYLGRQQRMVDTRNKVLGGSPTAQRHMDDARQVGDMLSGLVNSVRGGTNAALEIVASVANSAFGYSSDVSRELAKRLVVTDPREQARILAKLRQEMGEEPFRIFRQQLSDTMAKSAGAIAVPAANISASE